MVAIFAERVLKGEPVTLYARRTPGDEGCVRDYIFVKDVVRAHNLALKSLEGVYNVGTGEGHTTQEVLQAVAEAAGKTSAVNPAPPRPGDLERSVLSPAKLLVHGWRPEVGFAEGIRLTVEYFRAH